MHLLERITLTISLIVDSRNERTTLQVTLYEAFDVDAMVFVTGNGRVLSTAVHITSTHISRRNSLLHVTPSSNTQDGKSNTLGFYNTFPPNNKMSQACRSSPICGYCMISYVWQIRKLRQNASFRASDRSTSSHRQQICATFQPPGTRWYGREPLEETRTTHAAQAADPCRRERVKGSLLSACHSDRC